MVKTFLEMDDKNCIIFKNKTFVENSYQNSSQELISFTPIEYLPFLTYNRNNLSENEQSVCGPLSLILLEFARKRRAR